MIYWLVACMTRSVTEKNKNIVEGKKFLLCKCTRKWKQTDNVERGKGEHKKHLSNYIMTSISLRLFGFFFPLARGDRTEERSTKNPERKVFADRKSFSRFRRHK
jgi:hypothetical protein